MNHKTIYAELAFVCLSVKGHLWPQRFGLLVMTRKNWQMSSSRLSQSTKFTAFGDREMEKSCHKKKRRNIKRESFFPPPDWNAAQNSSAKKREKEDLGTLTRFFCVAFCPTRSLAASRTYLFDDDWDPAQHRLVSSEAGAWKKEKATSEGKKERTALWLIEIQRGPSHALLTTDRDSFGLLHFFVATQMNYAEIQRGKEREGKKAREYVRSPSSDSQSINQGQGGIRHQAERGKKVYVPKNVRQDWLTKLLWRINFRSSSVLLKHANKTF